ncbi:MAG: SRPBCC family protein [Bacteroidetes bacterium]|nr:SRPBCC family protein [Bacteroidota bacterium]
MSNGTTRDERVGADSAAETPGTGGRLKGMHLVLIALGILVVMAGAVGIIGAMVPVAHSASRTALLHTTPDQVWNRLASIEAYPKWRKELTGVEMLPPHNGHAMWREKSRSNNIVMEQDEALPNRRMVARIADTTLPFGGRWTFELKPEGTGTRITITEEGEVRNIFFRFMSRYVFGYTASMDQYLGSLGLSFNEEVTPEDPPAAPATSAS